MSTLVGGHRWVRVILLGEGLRLVVVGETLARGYDILWSGNLVLLIVFDHS